MYTSSVVGSPLPPLPVSHLDLLISILSVCMLGVKSNQVCLRITQSVGSDKIMNLFPVSVAVSNMAEL